MENWFKYGLFSKKFAPFNFLFWSFVLIIGSYICFLIFEPLCGIFIGWYLTESYYSMKKAFEGEK